MYYSASNYSRDDKRLHDSDRSTREILNVVEFAPCINILKCRPVSSHVSCLTYTYFIQSYCRVNDLNDLTLKTTPNYGDWLNPSIATRKPLNSHRRRDAALATWISRTRYNQFTPWYKLRRCENTRVRRQNDESLPYITVPLTECLPRTSFKSRTV